MFVGYAGDTCIEDRNGCADIECFRGVECRDIPAPGVGAVCGPCPSGFTGDGMKCSGKCDCRSGAIKSIRRRMCSFMHHLDIDDCAMDSSLCGQICVNTFGSYACDCNPGFRLLEDSITCEGIISSRCTIIHNHTSRKMIGNRGPQPP